LLSEKKLHEFCVVVFDELHMMSDKQDNRGSFIELMITKFMWAAKNSNTNIQIVGMSATVSNPELAQKWLKAELYSTDWRPVVLKNYLFNTNKREIKETNGNIIKDWKISPACDKDSTCLAKLVREITEDEGKSVLVFCSSKDLCKQQAKKLAEIFDVFRVRDDNNNNNNNSTNSNGMTQQTPLFEIDEPPELKKQRMLKEKREELIKSLSAYPIREIDRDLQSCLLVGMAWHHSDLTVEEREVVEKGFRTGIINVLFATSTLAAGVNLPARRVIFLNHKMGVADLTTSEYRFEREKKKKTKMNQK